MSLAVLETTGTHVHNQTGVHSHCRLVYVHLLLPAFAPPHPPLSLVATGPWLTRKGKELGFSLAAGARHPWKVSEEERRSGKIPFGATGTRVLRGFENTFIYMSHLIP